jgi:hypothetical protein
MKIAIRYVSSIVPALLGVWVYSRLGDSTAGKVAAIVVGATAVALIEWLLVWLPRKSPRVRFLLDPRDVWAGEWIQDVKSARGRAGDVSEEHNNFAILYISYDGDSYAVVGRSYDAWGREHSRWASDGEPAFTAQARYMSYRFKGKITNTQLQLEERKREGFVRMQLSSRESANDGSGSVVHVAETTEIEFDLQRITEDWLGANGLDGSFAAGQVFPHRDSFGVELARSRAARRHA